MNNRYIEDSEIRALRVRTWVRAVRLRSKLSLVELEERFSDTKLEEVKARSCIWDKYARGSTVPRVGNKPNGSPHLANRIEEHYPGTLQWLITPMWRLIDSAPMSMDEIKQVYEGMPTLTRSIFIQTQFQATGLFWRRIVDVESSISTLLKLGDLAAFIALLALVKEAETTQNQWMHHKAFEAILNMSRLLTTIKELDMTDEEILEYLLDRQESAGYFRE